MDQHRFESLVLFAAEHLWVGNDFHDYFLFRACTGVLNLLGEDTSYTNHIYAWSASIRDNSLPR